MSVYAVAPKSTALGLSTFSNTELGARGRKIYKSSGHCIRLGISIIKTTIDRDRK